MSIHLQAQVYVAALVALVGPDAVHEVVAFLLARDSEAGWWRVEH